jgi:hypothetical protein
MTARLPPIIYDAAAMTVSMAYLSDSLPKEIRILFSGQVSC